MADIKDNLDSPEEVPHSSTTDNLIQPEKNETEEPLPRRTFRPSKIIWQQAAQRVIVEQSEKNPKPPQKSVSGIVAQLQKLISEPSDDCAQLTEQERREEKWRRVADRLGLTVIDELGKHAHDGVVNVHEEGAEEGDDLFDKSAIAWLMVFLVFMINAIMDGYQYSCGLLFVAIIEEFQATNEEAAWISSIFQLAFCFVCPVGSFLMNMYGARFVSIVGTLLLTLGIITSSFVPGLWYLYITMGAIAGIGCGLLAFATSTMLCFWFDKKISLANGIARVGTGVGLFAFPPLVNFLIYELGWRSSCYILAGITLQCLVFSALMRPNSRIKVTVKPKDPEKSPLEFFIKKTVQISNELSVAQHGIRIDITEKPPSFKEQLSSVIRATFNFKLYKKSAYTIFVIGNVIGFFSFKTPFLYVPARAVSFGVSESNIGWMVSASGISNMVGRFLFGILADLSIFRTRRLPLYAFCWLICGLSTGLSIFPGFIPQVIYVAVYGMFFGSVILLQPVVVKDIVGLENLSAAFGILRLGTAFPSLLGAPLLGILYDATNDYRLLFGAAGGVMVLGAVILMLGVIIEKIKMFISSNKRNSNEDAVSSKELEKLT